MFFQLAINHPCWNFCRTGRWLSHYPGFLSLPPLIRSQAFQADLVLKARECGTNRMLVEKCLQNGKDESLIIPEPFNESRWKFCLHQTPSTLGLRTHTDVCTTFMLELDIHFTTCIFFLKIFFPLTFLSHVKTGPACQTGEVEIPSP